MSTSRRGKRKSQQSAPTPEERPEKTSREDDEDSMFSSQWKGSDAVLIVEDKELHVHTQTLSLASPVFEKMFNGSFKEAQTKKVNLEGKSYELIEHLLKIIYPIKARLGKNDYLFIIVSLFPPFSYLI